MIPPVFRRRTRTTISIKSVRRSGRDRNGENMPTQSLNPETIVLHGGSYRPPTRNHGGGGADYQTTSYQFNSTEHASNLFALKELGNVYTRIMNPTQAVLEERVARSKAASRHLGSLRDRRPSLFAGRNILPCRRQFRCSTDIYGGTWNLFQNTMSTMASSAASSIPPIPRISPCH